MRLCEDHRLGGIRDGTPHECVGCAFEALRAENVRLREGIEDLANAWLCLDHGGEEAERICALLSPGTTARCRGCGSLKGTVNDSGLCISCRAMRTMLKEVSEEKK
jgi:hypothetical protein